MPETDHPTPAPGAAPARSPSEHYENFPVASWLCPPRLRPPIAAIYWFARTADDLADEGDATAAQRMADLGAYRADLMALASGQPLSGRWPEVFTPLASALREFALPVHLLDALLSAFMQDVDYTAHARRYPDRDTLLDYCTRSANPVGRLLLHLYGVTDGDSLRRSDQVCSALQLINFWQDLSVDIPRGRYYVPGNEQLPALLDWTESLMLAGAPLCLRVPGRAGWELRLVVQGGLHVLRKTRALGPRAMSTRPRLRAWDAPALLCSAMLMAGPRD